MTAFLQVLGFAEDGHRPAGGGLLDQTQCFVDAWTFVKSERRVIAEELKNPNG